MTNAPYTHDRLLDQHQNSIMASLSHRLEVARANNNVRLVALLEQEKKQVASERDDIAPLHDTWWQMITQRFSDALFGGSSLQVCEVVDGSDRWWVASDPRTGEVVYADSEAEMRLWIKENYQGR